MGEFKVEVVRLENVKKHPNADRLSIVDVHGGYPVIFQSSEFSEGDLAVYVPVDAVVPDTEEWAWLNPAGPLRPKDRRIKAKRLRKIFSMGLLTKAPPGAVVGQDVAKELGIERWEEPEPEAVVREGQGRKHRGWRAWAVTRLIYSILAYFWPNKFYSPPKPVAPPKLAMPGLYDIEPFRKFGRMLFEFGEAVVITEKIHGQNARFVHDGKRLHIKSRTRWISTAPGSSTWADVAIKYDLAERLKNHPGIVVYGETYGNNADMTYGINRSETGDSLVVFDVFDCNKQKWLDWDMVEELADELGLEVVPVLDEFAWSQNGYDRAAQYAEGPAVLGGNHVREGFVIRPFFERFDPRFGRVILKMAGEGYLTRKTLDEAA